MQITVEIPDEIVRLLGTAAELPRKVLEACVADGYRTETLSRHKVGEAAGSGPLADRIISGGARGPTPPTEVPPPRS